MNGLGVGILLLLLGVITVAPRRWGAIALVMGALYATRGQVIEVGPANLTIPRLLVLAGFLRAFTRGERVNNGIHGVDCLMVFWALLLLATSAWHSVDGWVFRSGMIVTEVGCYLLFRIFLQELADVVFVLKVVCVAMVPIAALMLVEKQTGNNLLSVLGGVSELATIRDGNIRAGGPFAHPILAGTIGAACAAVGLALWRYSPFAALCGVLSGAGMVYASTSSGPVLMVLVMLVGFSLWYARRYMRLVLGVAAAGILLLSFVMNDPVYFLVARIDISGGSTGYFRAQLIRSSLEHLSEWWLAGTDYTRHWMPSGIEANSYHTDITNHILMMGVLGGLPLLISFLTILFCSFRDVGKAMRIYVADPVREQFAVWSLGVLLFGFFATFWSISLYDQSIVFFWLIVAAIQSVAHRPALPCSAMLDRTSEPMLKERTA
jgi:hypothetical protein